ncbi:GNAT family N-acetyltransferase [Desulfatirhabdium butyrativorans]|uniref:bifunctional acetate--CoA ligase family protein/GNAT family N-acetyltransferase n=1 Tax=Desulfatirhabdium butyrativorans TaxID=340467 RepID=UPI0003F76480|nr:GNAT family N-acetyltransferase [Desulfatirhabdium butyrativorans]
MGIQELDKMFRPRSVAVVGASPNTAKLGGIVLKNLAQRGFGGDIYPVNPIHTEIGHLKCYGSITDVEERVDLAILATPAPSLPEIMHECVKARVRGAIVLTSAGKKDERIAIEHRLRAISAEHGIRIIGPNSMGMIHTKIRLNASAGHVMPETGTIAFLSQSAAICTAILDMAVHIPVGFSHIVNLGAAIDVDYGDLLDFLGGDPQVASILLYLENLTNIRKFMSAARAVSRVKPIIALKAGRTPFGAQFAMDHTGASAGDDAVYDAAFERAGILRVKTFEELFDCAGILAAQPRPVGSGVVIITNSGGHGVMAADMLYEKGGTLTTLSEETLAKIDEILESKWSRTNPVHMPRDAQPEIYQKVVEACLGSPEVHGLIVLFSPNALVDANLVAKAVVEALKSRPTTNVTSWLGTGSVIGARTLFHNSQIPTYDTPERAVRAYMNICRHGEQIEMLQQIPPIVNKRLHFDADAVRTVLTRCLLENRFQPLPEEIAIILEAYGISPAMAAAKELSSSLASCRIRICLKTDPQFGPVICLCPEAVSDAVFGVRAIGLPPINRLLAKRLMQEGRIYELLRTYQITERHLIENLEDMIIRVSQLAIDFSEIIEMDLVVGLDGVSGPWVIQSSLQLQPAAVPAPLHLVISPYPSQYESQFYIDGLGKVLTRPIRPEDEPLLLGLFKSLSPRSIYMRFFTPMRTFQHSLLARFTQIDYDREIAQVAILEDAPEAEAMLGVARVIGEPNLERGEFAVVIRDGYQGKGIGAELLQQCLTIAGKRGMKTIYGIVLSENLQMLALGRKLGFKITRIPESSEYELVFKLDSKDAKPKDTG